MGSHDFNGQINFINDFNLGVFVQMDGLCFSASRQSQWWCHQICDLTSSVIISKIRTNIWLLSLNQNHLCVCGQQNKSNQSTQGFHLKASRFHPHLHTTTTILKASNAISERNSQTDQRKEISALTRTIENEYFRLLLSVVLKHYLLNMFILFVQCPPTIYMRQ